MTAFQFIASIIGSIAWPIVIIVIVILLRVPLSQIISSLTLHKLTYKDWQIDFGQKIAKLTLTADDANIPDIVPVIEKTGEQDEQSEKTAQLENKAKELEMKFYELEERLDHTNAEQPHQEDGYKVYGAIGLELERQKLETEKLRFELEKALSALEIKSISNNEQINLLAESAPTGAVILAWSKLEQEIFSTTYRLMPNAPSASLKTPIFQHINLLLSHNYIDGETAKILGDMRILRNKAAHRNVAGEEITYDGAMEYVRLANRMIQLLSSLSNNQYKAGDKVRHDKFGEGVVLKSEMVNDTEFLDVQFAGKYGKKRLSMDFANLEKL